jgi:hypothetical protein
MADAKITELTNLATPAVEDIIPIVDDVAGTPITKKSTLQAIFDLFKDLAITLTNKTLTSPKLNEDVALTSTATELNLLHGKLGAWTAITPTPTATAGTFTTASSTTRHIQIGKIVFIYITVNITTNGTAADAINVPLPVTPKSTSFLVGREGNVTGKMVNATLTSTNAVIRFYDNSYPGADGASISLSGCYEAT